MNNYSVFCERRINTPVKRNKLRCKSGEIKIEGRRAVDSATFTVKSPVNVSKEDIITCLIDDAPTEYLTGAWHFYFNTRDESGYNLDLTGTTSYVRNDTKSERFYGHVGLDCTSAGTTLTATPSANENNRNLLDFDDDGEIHIWCKTPSMFNGTQIIYSRRDANQGIEVGIKANGVNMYVFLRVKGSTSSISETGNDSYLEIDASSEVFIRVHKYQHFYSGSGYAIRRNNNNSSSFGAEYFTGTINPSTEVIRIGSAYNSGEQFRGILYSVKTYSKKMEDQYETIVFKRKQPYDTMKFGGRVTSVNKGSSNTTITCAGFSNDLLLKEQLKPDLINQTKYEDTLLETIVSDIIDDINTANTVDFPYIFVYDHPNDEDDDASQSWKTTSNQFHVRNIDKVEVTGTLNNYVKPLSILGGSEYNSSNVEIHLNGADFFFMTPRRVLIFESSQHENNTYFEAGLTSISDGGYDDSLMFNDVSVFSAVSIKVGKIVYTNQNSANTPNTFDLFANAGYGNKKFMGLLDVIVNPSASPNAVASIQFNPSQSGGYLWYDFNPVTGDLTINNPSATNYDFSVYYYYLDLTNDSDALTSLPSEETNNFYYNQYDQTSIDTYGKRAKRFIFSVIRDTTCLAAICRRLLARHKTPNRKILVKKSFLATHLHVGTLCSVSKKLNNIYSEELAIQGITYKFPNFSTIINVGQFEYNFLDELQITGETLDNIQNQGYSGSVKT